MKKLQKSIYLYVLLGLLLIPAIAFSGATFSRVKTWSTGETLTAAQLNAEFNNILNNLDPTGIDDESANDAAAQAVSDPYAGSSLVKATSLETEIQQLRYLIAQITGETYWYIDSDTTIAAIAAADWVTGARIVDNAIDSEHYTDDSIDTAHLADANVTIAKLATSVKITNIWISAENMTICTTNGTPVVRGEWVAHRDVRHLPFDTTTEEYGGFQMAMPENWDRGTIKAKFYWSGSTGCSAGDTVEWELAAVALSDDDLKNTALGTGQVITDTVLVGVDGDLHITSATPAITVGGTPALNDLIVFTVSRNVAGTDDMAEDAHLYGVHLQIVTDLAITAW